MTTQETIDYLSKEYRVPIINDQTDYQLIERMKEADMSVSAFVRAKVATGEIIEIKWAKQDRATDKEVLTTIFHEIGHVIDRPKSDRLYSVYSEIFFFPTIEQRATIMAIERGAWIEGIKLADSMGVELDYDDAYRCLKTYWGAELDIINERRHCEKQSI